MNGAGAAQPESLELCLENSGLWGVASPTREIPAVGSSMLAFFSAYFEHATRVVFTGFRERRMQPVGS